MNISEMSKMADLASKISGIVSKVQKLDADKNGVLDEIQYKTLIAKILTDSEALHQDLEKLGALIGADAKELGLEGLNP